MLHHPMTKVQDIQHRIIGKGVHLSDKAIIDFLVHHDLQKKTMDRNFFNAWVFIEIGFLQKYQE